MTKKKKKVKKYFWTTMGILPYNLSQIYYAQIIGLYNFLAWEPLILWGFESKLVRICVNSEFI